MEDRLLALMEEDLHVLNSKVTLGYQGEGLKSLRRPQLPASDGEEMCRRGTKLDMVIQY